MKAIEEVGSVQATSVAIQEEPSFTEFIIRSLKDKVMLSFCITESDTVVYVDGYVASIDFNTGFICIVRAISAQVKPKTPRYFNIRSIVWIEESE